MNDPFDTIIQDIEAAWEKDHPQTVKNLFKEASTTYLKTHDYERHLRLLLASLSIPVLEEDLLRNTEEGLRQVEEVSDKTFAALYYMVAAMLCPYNEQEKRKAYAAKALSDPAHLATVRTDDYPWLVKRGEDSHLFGRDLLSFIGMETESWETLYEYYKTTDKRGAACYTAVQAIVYSEADDADRYTRLMDVLREYDDLPEVCEAVDAIMNYDLLPLPEGEGLEADNARQETKYQFLKPYVDRWASYPHVGRLHNRLEDLRSHLIRISVNEKEIPHRPITLKVTRRNVSQFTLNIYDTDLTSDKASFSNIHKRQATIQKNAYKLPLYSKTYECPAGQSYFTYEDNVTIDGLEPGIYFVQMTSEYGKSSPKLLYVSGLTTLTEFLPGSKIRIVVVDPLNGHPVPYAHAALYKSHEEGLPFITLLCDEKGEVVYRYNQRERPASIFPFTESDRYCKEECIDIFWGYRYDSEGATDTVEILTDRAIYRPGQTVHAALVSYRVNKNKRVMVQSRHIGAELAKPYKKPIAQELLVTDTLGVAHCDFVLPDDIETGVYTVRCGRNSRQLRIEAYKRPTFEVKIDDYTGSYRDGDTILLEGSATSYTGEPVSQATVRYRVKRATAWWWRFWAPYWETEGDYGRYGEDEYHNGEATTDDEGNFKIEVPLRLSNNGKVGRKPLFVNIVTEVDVTDTTGETQNARTELPLSNKQYVLRVEMSDKIERQESLTFTALLKNALGQDLAGSITWQLDDGEEHTAPANQQIEIGQTDIGAHTLKVRYGEDEAEHTFVVFDKDSTTVPYSTPCWAYQSADEFPEDGGEVILQIGCADADTYILYNLFAGNKLLESGAEKVSTGMINRRLRYDKAYGGGILVSYAWIRNHEMQTHNFTIKKALPDRKLQITWKTFRDRVTPGTEEEWTLQVKDPAGRNVTANVIATLYDKSLDQLTTDTSWQNFGPRLSWQVPHTDWEHETLRSNDLSVHHIEHHKEREYQFYDIVQTLIGGARYRRRYFGMSHSALACMEEEERLCLRSESVRYNLSVEADAAPLGAPPALDEAADTEALPPLRTDMSETAFFLPQLATDSDGEVSIVFTVPDSLTTWRFKALAHTRDLRYAYFDAETIARKPVMVQSHLPRFVRVGDATTLTAKVTNTTEDAISGRVQIELLDARDERMVFSERHPFMLDAGGSMATSFTFTPDEEVKDYLCRLYAVGDGFSDGEQHALPVLTDKAEVTVTHVLNHDGACKDEVDTARLLPAGSSRHALSLQYTNHPIWLAINALPPLQKPDTDNAISLSVALFCNHLTTYLQNIAAHFGDLSPTDTDALAVSKRKIVRKLKKLQGRGGGFSWYEKMPESLYMTTEVVMHLSRLQVMAGPVEELASLTESAFRFCDAAMCKDVRELRKWEAEGHAVYLPTFTLLQHLYNCAITRRELDSKTLDAYQYLVALLEKDIHSQTIREKAMSAVILDYAGYHSRAQDYAESLRQYTVCDAERGRTFETPRATYSWYSYKIPTHVAGMEALHLLCPDDHATYREMQKWLLQEKRTQTWETPIDSVNAVYALLLDGQEELDTKSTATFTIDGKPLAVETEGNEGCMEAALPATTRTLTVEKTTPGLSWGAVYATFLQPLCEVEASGSGMSIHREILADTENLHVGDRIRVRLTYTCDRDFDMVRVTDSKAACMEPVKQLSWGDSFKRVQPMDTEVRIFYYGLAEGTYSIETEYYLDRAGVYETGLATIVCEYAPEFRAVCPSVRLVVK